MIHEQVKQLIEKYGQNDQRTDAWHAKRGEMLTASEIYKALPDATPAQKHELMVSKLTPRTKSEGLGGRALIWGTRFEPIAKQIYCKMSSEKIEIVDTTCIPHPTVSFLGASPDGIVLTEDIQSERYGHLVEFKCPISRVFTKDTPIPAGYYHQMQLQMECTQLKTCEYIEMKFKAMSYSEWMDTQAEYKGVFAVVPDGTVFYKDSEDTRDLKQWTSDVLQMYDFWENTFWVLEFYRTEVVQHDPEWLTKNLPSMESVWKEILDHREKGSMPEHPKEKTTLTL
jgi:putative phage-type endonuclease